MAAGKKKAVLLRIPPELWDDLNVWARDELRSVNAQIEYALREALRRRKRSREAPGNDPKKLLWTHTFQHDEEMEH